MSWAAKDLGDWVETAKRDPRARWLGVALIAVALAVLPFVAGAVGGRGWGRIIDFALLYVMLSLRLNIVVGVAGLLATVSLLATTAILDRLLKGRGKRARRPRAPG